MENWPREEKKTLLRCISKNAERERRELGNNKELTVFILGGEREDGITGI